ncbi:MAG TPA: hypothetical protein VKV73_30520 [Chloroflexota bacterium]|nr:hypothetical protein [Chloroflexota bacterium]
MSLLEPSAQAELLAQHQDSPATQLVAQEAGKLGTGYDAVINDNAPRATLTAPVWFRDLSILFQPVQHSPFENLSEQLLGQSTR